MPVVLFIVTIPLLIAFGHDLYLLYTNPDKGFEFATLGWIWATYHPDSLKATGKFVAENIGEDIWKAIAPVFSQYAVTLGAIFATLFYVPFGLYKLMVTTSPRKSNSADRLLSRHKNRKKSKYGRK